MKAIDEPRMHAIERPAREASSCDHFPPLHARILKIAPGGAAVTACDHSLPGGRSTGGSAGEPALAASAGVCSSRRSPAGCPRSTGARRRGATSRTRRRRRSAIRSCPAKGWRIYTVAATMPTFDRATWRLSVSGLVEQPQELSYDELRALPQASQVTDLPLRDGLDVQKASTGAACGSEDLARAREAALGRARAPVRLGREAVRRLPHARPGDAPQRDARLGDGREAAASRSTARRCAS